MQQRHGQTFRYANGRFTFSKEAALTGDLQVGEDTVRRVDRVLDVRQGEICWVAGTVYMDMPLKPNILDDISKDVCSMVMLNLSGLGTYSSSNEC